MSCSSCNDRYLHVNNIFAVRIGLTCYGMAAGPGRGSIVLQYKVGTQVHTPTTNWHWVQMHKSKDIADVEAFRRHSTVHLGLS